MDETMAYKGSESQEIGRFWDLKGRENLWVDSYGAECRLRAIRSLSAKRRLRAILRSHESLRTGSKIPQEFTEIYLGVWYSPLFGFYYADDYAYEISLDPELGDDTTLIGKGSKFSAQLVEIRVREVHELFNLLFGELHHVDDGRTSLQFERPYYADGQGPFEWDTVADGGRDEINLKGIGDYSRQFGGAHYADSQGPFEWDTVADGGRGTIGGVPLPNQGPFKCIMVGDGGTGKTTYMKQKLTGEFETKYEPTMGMHEHMLDVPTKQGSTRFLCVDTPGHEKPGTPRDEYYKGAACCIIVCDITAKQTQKDVSMWHDDVRRVCDDIPTVVCGNKVDLKQRQVTFHMKKKLQYYEISAKSGYNLDRPFQYLAEKLAGYVE